MRRFMIAAILLLPGVSYGRPFQRHFDVHVESNWSGYTVLGLSADAAGSLTLAGGRGYTPQTMNAFLLRLDSDGATSFLRDYPFSEADGIASAPDGGFFVVGHRYFNNNPLVFRTDAAGNVLWASSVDAGYIEQGFWGVCATSDGGCLASGIYTARLTPAGNVLWLKYAGVTGFGCGTDGLGNEMVGGIGNRDVPRTAYNFGLTQFADDGHVLWSRAFGTNDNEHCYFFTPLVGGGYLLAGETQNQAGSDAPHAELMKVGQDGRLLWARTYVPPGNAASHAHGVVATTDGGAIFTGDAGGRILLVRIDGNGAVQWSWSYDAGSGYPLVSLSTGGYALAGVGAQGELVAIQSDALGRTGCEVGLLLSVQAIAAAEAPTGIDVSQAFTRQLEMPAFTSSAVTGGETCAPVATLLEDFEAVPEEEGLQLRWRWSSPVKEIAVDLQRTEPSVEGWRTLTNAPRSENGWWIALDRDVEPGRAYTYRLVSTGMDGPQLLGVTTGQTSRVAARTRLELPEPSPSRKSVHVRFALAQSGPIEIDVVDVRGRVVATPVRGWRPGGGGECRWDGFAGAHRAVAGVYFIRLRTASETATRRFVLLQ